MKKHEDEIKLVIAELGMGKVRIQSVKFQF